MKEIRCKECNKLLGQFHGKGEVKCPRMNCGKINRFDTVKGSHVVLDPPIGTPLSQRKTSSGVTFR